MSKVSKSGLLVDQYLQYMEEVLPKNQPAALYEPVQYIMHLGGKRFRPLLALMAGDIYEAPIESLLPIAHAVEVFHNFSLVHDDIMDEAPLRRGKPTVHTLYNLNTGVLSGDAMLILAYQSLLKSPLVTTSLVSAFSKIALEVCEGQQHDMNFEKQEQVSIADYLHMIEQKTAALLGGSLALGAMAAQTDEKNVYHLDQFGRNMGIAFQIQDDLLDAFGSPEKVGKKPGGDIAQNKKTYLYLRALADANAETKETLVALYKGAGNLPEEDKIRTVLAIFESLDIANKTKELQDQYQQKAEVHLSQVTGNPDAIQALREMALGLIVRDF